MKNIFNIRSSCSFWDCLAEHYSKKYADNDIGLASALFLVPNRRASRALLDAFLRINGRKPTILPTVIPISEIDDDELFFNEFILNGNANDYKRPIENEERIFLFTRMIMSKPNDFGLKQISLAQALNLAIDLAKMMDIAYNKGLSFDKLKDLVPEKYASHWQETLKLLEIITEFWPQILSERNAIDISEMKKNMIINQAELWEREKTDRNIIVAGVNANFVTIIKILKTVKNLKNGEIYFAGIDRFADDEYWDTIDEANPQFELKELLNASNINRHEIIDLCLPKNEEREHLVSELMRPAKVSNKWLDIKGLFDADKAISGISLINCNSQRDEALAIALKMREVLAQEEKTAALVTYDRNLSRRVAVELERFGIKIDDSAGIPLSLTHLGIYLQTLLETAYNFKSDTAFINLLKNPLTLAKMNNAQLRQKVYEYEVKLRKKEKLNEDDTSFVKNIQKLMQDLIDAVNSSEIEFLNILKTHIQIAEIIASSDCCDGKNFLWKGDAGKICVKFIAKLMNSGEILGKISGKDYIALFSELMSQQAVRSNYGTHPRLSILGPIEARLHHFDCIILGEMNEGVWPKQTPADMWMSRPMKADFGFSLPERDIGILAFDLACFLTCDNVILTRADRVDGVPMKKSRWLLRLETILKALDKSIDDITSIEFSDFVGNVDKPNQFIQIASPQPTPPLYARPRKLSASAVDLLMHDPYSVFARYILKLYRLDDLDIPLDQRDYGTLIHEIIEEFNNTYPNKLPDEPLDKLINIGKRHFKEKNIDKELEAFWFPKFLNTAQWIIAIEKDYRESVSCVNNEIEGEVSYNIDKGAFTFTAKADRIDMLKDGSLNILDYKTGNIPSKKQVQSGHAIQLLLEALIAKKGTFKNINNNNLRDLIYWQLGSCELVIPSDEDDLIDKAEDYLLKLVSTFDFETTPYCCRPIPKYIPKNRDYEHLARIKEWSVVDEGENNG